MPETVTEIVTEVMVLPDRMELDDVNAHSFAILVRWRGARTETGRGGYAITHHGNHLSHKGKWRYEPEPYLQRHFGGLTSNPHSPRRGRSSTTSKSWSAHGRNGGRGKTRRGTHHDGGR